MTAQPTSRTAQPTPVGADGAPLRAPSDLVARLAQVPQERRADAVAAALAALASTPVVEGEAEVDGVACVAVTFLAVHADPSAQVLVHVNSLTDRHRTHIAPAVMERLDGTDLWHRTWWVPSDLVASYRIAVGEPFADDVGRDRPGWLRVHERGRPDPLNPHRLPNPLGHESSVLVGPRGRVHPAWLRAARTPQPVTRLDVPDPVVGGTRTVWVAGPRDPGRVLIAFDGDTWHDGLDLASALTDTPQGSGTAVVMVSSTSAEARRRVLPDPEAVGSLLADAVLPAVRGVLGALPGPDGTVVSGQSFGGLAAAGVVVTRPDISTRAIVQSGSFQYKHVREMVRDDRIAGDLVRRIRSAGVADGIEVAMQWGSEEGELGAVGRQAADALRDAGARVTTRVYAGGHDYAWWRTGLLDALATLSPHPSHGSM